MRNIFITLCFLMLAFQVQANELNARVTVVSNRVSDQVVRKSFKTLQTAMHNFLNTRKWTGETYSQNERIDCNFLIDIESTGETNVFRAQLTVQAARPIFNTNYLSPIINFKDENVIFKYIEFQQLEFNENRVSGSDPLVSNLTAVLAYYVNLIIAFDADSFSPKGGEPYFQKAQNIVNNAPDGRGISGWKAFDGIRNRYWLVENMSNTRYAIMHDIYYNYYRLVLDKFYENDQASRAELLNVINQLDKFIADNPNTMIAQFFFQGKSTELIKIFSKAKPAEKARALELLPKMDITNSNKYKEGLK